MFGVLAKVERSDQVDAPGQELFGREDRQSGVYQS